MAFTRMKLRSPTFLQTAIWVLGWGICLAWAVWISKDKPTLSHTVKQEAQDVRLMKSGFIANSKTTTGAKECPRK
jgi:hypothetical protein